MLFGGGRERQRGMVMSSTNDGRLRPPGPGRKLSLGQRHPATAVSLSFIPSALIPQPLSSGYVETTITTTMPAEGLISASG